MAIEDIINQQIQKNIDDQIRANLQKAAAEKVASIGVPTTAQTTPIVTNTSPYSEDALSQQLLTQRSAIEAIKPENTIADQIQAMLKRYEALKAKGLSDLQAQYQIDKERMASELASTGRWGTGVGKQNLGVVEAARSKGISDLITSLLAQQAQEEKDIISTYGSQNLASKEAQATGQGSLTNTISNLLNAQNQRAFESWKQKDAQNQENWLFDRAVAEGQLAEERKKNANKPTSLDFVNTGLKAIDSAANVIRTIKQR